MAVFGRYMYVIVQYKWFLVINGLLFLFFFTLSLAFLVWQLPDSFGHMTHWTWFAHLLAYAYLIAQSGYQLILLTHM